MSERTNPAKRLFTIFKNANNISDQTPSRKAFAQILNVPHDDTRALLRSLADFIRLVDEARDEVQRLKDVNTEIYLKPFDRIHTAFSEMNLQSPWSHFRRYLDPATMTALEFSSDTLNKSWIELPIESKTLEDLLKDIQQLVIDVSHAEINDELKAVILENLERMQHAILAYDLVGVRGLRDALESSLGSLFMNKDRLHSVSSMDKKEKTIINRFFEQLDRMNKLVAAARGLKAIASPIIKLLGGPNLD